MTTITRTAPATFALVIDQVAPNGVYAVPFCMTLTLDAAAQEGETPLVIGPQSLALLSGMDVGEAVQFS